MLLRFLLRRLLLLPVILLVVNFTGFVYASLALRYHQAQNPYGHVEQAPPPVLQNYLNYASGVLRLDLGVMPVGAQEPIARLVGQAALASLGLLGAAFILSLLLGLALGRLAVQVDPPRSRSWLTALSTLGQAVPGFYIGTLLVAAVIAASLDFKMAPLVPVAGFGWDLHLVLPILALMLRPTVQIAHVTASLLSDELGKRYVTAARGFGHTWRDILRDKALRNILAPLFLTISGSFRLSVAELLLIEWLFSWPGIGGMLVRTLVPPRVVASLAGFNDVSVYFLNPPILALLLVIFGLLFYLVDILASLLARRVDPRLESSSQEEASYG